MELNQSLKEALLYLAEEIKRICEKNKINYYIDCGTMLGAVRHKGFIPWDDDMDIGMMKEDYERFITIAPNELKQDFYLDNYLTNPKCPFGYSKLRLKGTKLIEEKGNKNDHHNEIFIDIFPYFYVPDDIRKWKWDALILSIAGQAILSKAGCKVWAGDKFIKRLKFIPTDIIGFCFSFKRMRSWVLHYFNKYSCTNTMTVLDGRRDSYMNWRIPREYFDEYLNVEFEGHIFPIPKHFDEYLTIGFGDYMTVPPIEERTTHNIIELDLGDQFWLNNV